MKSYMATIVGPSSELINKRIQDELTDLCSYSMKKNFIISFHMKNVSYREQTDEPSTQVMQVPGMDDLYIPVYHSVETK